MVTGRGTNAGFAVLAALAMVTVMPGAVGVASADDVPTYKTAAPRISGTADTAHAPELKPGLHTDVIGRGETKIYAVPLDAENSAYFSAVAAPKPGSKVENIKDKLSVKVQDREGSTCGAESSQYFHAEGTAYPIGDYASREIGGGNTGCQTAGPYYVVVTREGSATSGTGDWPIELGYIKEPPVKGSAPTPPAEDSPSTVTPAPPSATDRRKAHGGTGFNDAGVIGTGVWNDRIRPGETRFYRVPVDWGQRLNLSAELPNAPSSSSSSMVSHALGLNIFNPARGAVVDDNFVSYNGKGASAEKFTDPVEYANRFRSTEMAKAMRFAGWYYLEVTLNSAAAQYFPQGADLTLRVDVRGRAKPGPAYTAPVPEFTVTDQDREAARTGRTPQEAERSGTLRTVAYAGIGTGVVLLTGLGAWTLVARRRAAGAPAVPGTPGTAGTLPGQAQQPPQPLEAQQGDSTQQVRSPRGW
ncbi:hypothetical protein [Streptomyces chattanoogensis]|uniref:hypothetical protein n=1 Tax=Streptomyces chattanoogensis TaxID=66876 RepID=UPI0036B7E041